MPSNPPAEWLAHQFLVMNPEVFGNVRVMKIWCNGVDIWLNSIWRNGIFVSTLSFEYNITVHRSFQPMVLVSLVTL